MLFNIIIIIRPLSCSRLLSCEWCNTIVFDWLLFLLLLWSSCIGCASCVGSCSSCSGLRFVFDLGLHPGGVGNSVSFFGGRGWFTGRDSSLSDTKKFFVILLCLVLRKHNIMRVITALKLPQNEVNVFTTKRAAATYACVHVMTVSRALKERKIVKKRWLFAYAHLYRSKKYGRSVKKRNTHIGLS